VAIKQMYELGIQQPLLAGPTFQVPEVAEAQDSRMPRAYYSYPASSGSKAAAEFAKKYKQLHPDSADLLPMYLGAGYDGIKLLYQLLRSCGEENADCLREQLLKVSGWEGVNGPISFDQSGNNSTGEAIEIRVLEGGKFKVIPR